MIDHSNAPSVANSDLLMTPASLSIAPMAMNISMTMNSPDVSCRLTQTRTCVPLCCMPRNHRTERHDRQCNLTTERQANLRQLPHPIITSCYNTSDQRLLNIVFQPACSPDVLCVFYIHINSPHRCLLMLNPRVGMTIKRQTNML